MADPRAALVVQPGELRHSVQIQQLQGGQASDGSPTQSWTTVLSPMAAIMTASSREVYQAAQFTAQVSHVLKIRWTAVPLSGGMQVLYGSRTFKVQAIENVLERNRVLMLHCLELNGVQGDAQ